MGSTSLETRIISSNDLIQIEDLLRILTSYPMDDADLVTTSNRYSSELNEKENRVFLLGFETDNSPFGYVQLIVKNADNDPELANGVDIAHIHDLRVRSDLQGKGFERGLMTYLEDEARLREIKTLTLGVDNWNSRAIQFYKNLEYSEFKREPGRTDDEFVICMRKII